MREINRKYTEASQEDVTMLDTDAEYSVLAGTSMQGSVGRSSAELVIFSNVELLDFRKGRAVLHPRLTCYPRHHDELVGFRYD